VKKNVGVICVFFCVFVCFFVWLGRNAYYRSSNGRGLGWEIGATWLSRLVQGLRMATVIFFRQR
jgi:hypothetical protein